MEPFVHWGCKIVKPIKRLQIGKKGLTPSFVNQVRSIFEKKKERVVKITILKSARKNKDEAREIAERLVRELGENYGYKLVGYVLVIMKFRKGKVKR